MSQVKAHLSVFLYEKIIILMITNNIMF